MEREGTHPVPPEFHTDLRLCLYHAGCVTPQKTVCIQDRRDRQETPELLALQDCRVLQGHLEFRVQLDLVVLLDFLDLQESVRLDRQELWGHQDHQGIRDFPDLEVIPVQQVISSLCTLLYFSYLVYAIVTITVHWRIT